MVFKVTKKPKTPNILWDAAGNRPLCRFKNGTFETEDEALARNLQALGYVVDPEPAAKEPEPPLDPPAADQKPPQEPSEDNLETPEDNAGDNEKPQEPQGELESTAPDPDADDKRPRRNSKGK